MTRVEGMYTAEDAKKASAALAHKIAGIPTVVAVLEGLLIGSGSVAGFLLWDGLPWVKWLWPASIAGQPWWVWHLVAFAFRNFRTGIIGFLLCFAVLRWVCNCIDATVVRRRAKRYKVERQYPRPWSYVLDPQALTADDGGMRKVVQWHEVDGIHRCGNVWVFILCSVPDYLDSRCFPDPAAERAFIAEALSYMSEAARARSPDAVKFVAEGSS